MRFLLLQVRNADDPIRSNEQRAFARSIGCAVDDIALFNCLEETLSPPRLDAADMVLVGGAGAYSVVDQAPWLHRTLDGLRLIYERRVPMFASCWGFQALARALGGTVINDRSRAEVGTYEVRLTEAGRLDPVFGQMPETFYAHMGHEDHVTVLPRDAVLLASSERNENQAYTFPDRPIYATQFHPELKECDLKQRVAQYPWYVEEVAGITIEELYARCRPTDECASLVPAMIARFMGQRAGR